MQVLALIRTNLNPVRSHIYAYAWRSWGNQVLFLMRHIFIFKWVRCGSVALLVLHLVAFSATSYLHMRSVHRTLYCPLWTYFLLQRLRNLYPPDWIWPSMTSGWFPVEELTLTVTPQGAEFQNGVLHTALERSSEGQDRVVSHIQGL